MLTPLTADRLLLAGPPDITVYWRAWSMAYAGHPLFGDCAGGGHAGLPFPSEAVDDYGDATHSELPSAYKQYEGALLALTAVDR